MDLLIADRQSDTVEPPLTATSKNGHLSTKATFLVDSPYTVYWLFLFKPLYKMATFFIPQGGHCGDVQLYIYSHNVMAWQCKGKIVMWVAFANLKQQDFGQNAAQCSNRISVFLNNLFHSPTLSKVTLFCIPLSFLRFQS